MLATEMRPGVSFYLEKVIMADLGGRPKKKIRGMSKDTHRTI